MKRSAGRFFAVSAVLVLLAASPSHSEGIISWSCPAGKAVFCDQAWAFDEPVPSTTCTVQENYVSMMIDSTVTNGTCPQVITRAWIATDYCGNTSYCSQAVTLIDTGAPQSVCGGINHVPNPGFEAYSSCPDYYSQTVRAFPWYPPNVATPDYFSSCAPGSPVDVPTNFAGTQWPLSGSSYAGAILFYNTSNNAANSYREYLQVPLIAPLFSGQIYRVAFHVSLGEESSWSIADIGAHLSVLPVTDPVTDKLLPVSPQVANAPTNQLSDTASWMLVEGYYAAAGGEQYLTLGNFTADAATAFAPAADKPNNVAYYYFDDVTVEAVCEPDVTGKTVVCGSGWSFDAPRAVDACSGTNVAVSADSTVTNGICPLMITRTWSLTDPCGNTGTWSQTVTVLDTSPPEISCGCLQDAALEVLYTNACEGIVPDLSIFTNCFTDVCGPAAMDQWPAAGSLLGPGLHMITSVVYDCSGNSATCTVPFLVDAPAPVIVSPGDFTVVTCSNSLPVAFNVSATGHSGGITCIPPPGSIFTQGVTLVTCIATSACGVPAESSFTVTVKPPKFRWGCGAVSIGIGIPYTLFGGATAALRTTGPDYPALDVTPDTPDAAASGILLSPGPAEAVSFSTVLDFSATPGSGIRIAAPPDGLSPTGITLLSIHAADGSNYALRVGARGEPAADALYRADAVTTNGDLLASYAFTADEQEAGDLLTISAQPGVSNCHVDIEISLTGGGVSVGFPGSVVARIGKKGWDGCIYGPDRPVKKPTARVIFTPPPPLVPQPPLTELMVSAAGWPSWSLEQPALTAKGGKKYGDGHVTLMKAFDDGSEAGVDFAVEAPGGSVHVNLGYAASFSFGMRHDNPGGAPDPYLEIRAAAGPPDTTNTLRFAADQEGLGEYDGFVDFSAWGVTGATLRLIDGGTVAAEAYGVSASMPGPAAFRLSALPDTVSSPSPGVWSLSGTGGVTVTAGIDCGLPSCTGQELQVVAEPEAGSVIPLAVTALQLLAAEDMDMRVSNLSAVPACTNDMPLSIRRETDGTHVSWPADGFRLQGAASPAGPWIDLGNQSPAFLYLGSPTRVFRLVCE